MIKEAISKAMNKENLTREEALQVMKEIMSGEAEQSQVAAFLVALHMKGETAEEISACAEGMRSFATKLDRGDMDVIDIVGTGGDRSNTFNISTTAAIVTAAAGGVWQLPSTETEPLRANAEPPIALRHSVSI